MIFPVFCTLFTILYDLCVVKNNFFLGETVDDVKISTFSTKLVNNNVDGVDITEEEVYNVCLRAHFTCNCQTWEINKEGTCALMRLKREGIT